MNQFWAQYKTVFEVAIGQALVALAAFASLSAGVLSFAPVAFAALGGFTAGQLVTTHEMSLLLVLPICIVAGTATAYLLSFVFLRLETHYLALATLALLLITRVLVLNLSSLTGGPNGLLILESLSFPWLLAILAVVCVFFERLRRSRFGLAADAVRREPDVAETLGIATNRIRRIAFTISGAIGALGGALIATILQYIDPNTFYLDLAFVMIAAIVLGSAYYWVGAVIGAAVFTALPEVLKHYMDVGYNIANGVVLILIMLVMPRGLADALSFRRLRERVASRREREPVGVAATER